MGFIAFLEGCPAGDQRGTAALVRKHCGAGSWTVG